VGVPQELVSRYPAVSRESWDRIERFVERLLAWQARINLIAPSTVPALWERHVADSLQLLPLLPTGPLVIADLGSGGGFPGMVLACCGYQVHLHESNGKKVAFLRDALYASNAPGQVNQGRLEDAKPSAAVGAVTARALAPLPELLGLAAPFLASGPGFFHKGEDVDSELTQARKSWRFQVKKHPSVTDSKAVILQVWELEKIG
jgi:16S rRNA (guanine527-N7)-methyltransferase